MKGRGETDGECSGAPSFNASIAATDDSSNASKALTGLAREPEGELSCFSESCSNVSKTHQVLSMAYNSPPQSWPTPPSRGSFTMGPMGSVLDGSDASASSESSILGRRSHKDRKCRGKRAAGGMPVLSEALAGPGAPSLPPPACRLPPNLTPHSIGA